MVMFTRNMVNRGHYLVHHGYCIVNDAYCLVDSEQALDYQLIDG